MGKQSITQKLFAHGGVYALSRMLNQGVGFLLLPVLARYLGPEGYGMLSLATTVAGIASIFMIQGLSGSWYRLRFDHSGEELRKFDSTILWYVIVSLAVGILLISLLGPSLTPLWFPGLSFFPVLFLALLVEACTELINLFQRKQQAEQKPRPFLITALVRNSLSLAVALLFVVGFERGVAGRLEGELLVLGAICVFFIVQLRPSPPWQIDGEKLSRSLRYGLPLVPHQLAGMINSVADRALINYFIGLGPAGLYAMGYKLASVGAVLATAMNQAFSALVYESLTGIETQPAAERESRHLAIRRSSIYFVTAVAIFLLSITSVARETLLVMVSKDFEPAWKLVPLLAAGILVISAYQPLSNMIILHNRVGWLPIATIASALVNVGLNVLMLPRFGVLGAAWATLLSNLLMFGIAARVSGPLFQTYRWTTLSGLGAVSGAGFFGLWALDGYLHTLIVRLPLKLAMLLIIAGALLKIAGVRVKDVGSLFRLARRHKA